MMNRKSNVFVVTYETQNSVVHAYMSEVDFHVLKNLEHNGQIRIMDHKVF